MAKVTNLTDRVQPLLRWKVLPKGSRLVDPKGDIRDSMPDNLAYSDIAKSLADQGVLELEGYTPKSAAPPPAPEPPPEPKKSAPFGKKLRRDED